MALPPGARIRLPWAIFPHEKTHRFPVSRVSACSSVHNSISSVFKSRAYIIHIQHLDIHHIHKFKDLSKFTVLKHHKPRTFTYILHRYKHTITMQQVIILTFCINTAPSMHIALTLYFAISIPLQTVEHKIFLNTTSKPDSTSSRQNSN